MSSPAFRTIKFIILLIAGFAAFIFVSSVLVNNEFHVERSVVIDQPKDYVFEYIRYLENQYNYSVWGELDPDMHREFRGTDGTVGFVSAWDGDENAGRGEQEIVGIDEGNRIDYELRFYEPFESSADSYMTTESVGENQTRVTWGMSGSMPRPFNLMMLFFSMEEAIGNDYETGLNNLKAILEDE